MIHKKTAYGANRSIRRFSIYTTGIQVGEVQYLTVGGYSGEESGDQPDGEDSCHFIAGKTVPEAAKVRRKAKKIVSGEIFLIRDGMSLSRKQIWREIKSLCAAAGVAPSKVFPHNLRHLFATAFYRVCRDIVKLADVLGQRSIEITRIYLRSTGIEHIRHLERMQLIAYVDRIGIAEHFFKN